MLAPDPLHARERYVAKFNSPLAAAPVGRSITGQVLQSPVEHTCFQPGNGHCAHGRAELSGWRPRKLARPPRKPSFLFRSRMRRFAGCSKTTSPLPMRSVQVARLRPMRLLHSSSSALLMRTVSALHWQYAKVSRVFSPKR